MPNLGKLERGGRHICQTPNRRSELAPVPWPAGENQNLNGFRRLPKCELHSLEAIVVGIDQSVIEDDGSGIALFSKIDREGQSNEDRQLLPRADAQRRIRLFPAVARNSSDLQRFLVESEARTGEEQSQKRVDRPQNRLEKFLLGIALGSLQGADKQVPGTCVGLQTIASTG